MWEFSAKKTDRLDRVLREEVFAGSEWISRQAWDWLFENGLVEVNGRKCAKSGATVPEGAKVGVRFPCSELGLRPAARAASLLWADQRLALFYKPVGIASLPIFPWDHGAFANEVAASLAQAGTMSAEAFAALANAPVLEGGLLQRLDQDTSGIVAVALDAETKLLFRQLFSHSGIEKTYLAIVAGEGVSGLDGAHEVWLSPGGAKVKAQLLKPKGEAESSGIHVEVLKASGQAALVKVLTSQGARHIVRASMAALGAPLVGDALYGGTDRAPFHQLHASRLRLLRPAEYPSFPGHLEADPPESFLDSLRALGLH